jgi:fructose-1,6-bisphosphatase II
MDKIAAGAEGRGVLELEKPIGENIRALAAAKGKNLEDMVVAVLDRPRHDEMIRQIRATGAGTRLLFDGDVAGGISATLPGSKIDMCVGVGGTPEASSRRARSRRSVV